MAQSGGSFLACLLLCLSSTSAFDTELDDISSDPRLFFVNYTSSLLAINTTILLYAVAAAATVGAIVLAVYLLSTAPAPASYGSYAYSQGYQARGFRQNTGYNILHLLAVASDLYQKVDRDDVDCQRKIMCEFFDEPEIFGSGAVTLKSGVQTAASWLRPFGFTFVDQITKATTLDTQETGNCEQKYRECDRLSLKETAKEKAKIVNEVKSDLNKESEKEKEVEKSEEEYEYYYEDDESRRK